MRKTLSLVVCLAAALGVLTTGRAAPVHVRVTLLGPADTPYQVHVIARPFYGTNIVFVVGQTKSALLGSRYYPPSAAEVEPLTKTVTPLNPGQSSAWLDLTEYLIGHDLATVQFYFLPAATFTNCGVRARFDVATAPDEKSIVRTITDHDPANIISLRVPRDLVKDKEWLLSIREDGVRRLNEIRALGLPKGPLPRKIWMMTGFRPWGMFTDPTITEMDFQVIQELGMNGYWDFTPETWPLAQKYGIDRTTVYWRAPGAPPGFNTPAGIALDWDKLGQWIDDAYQRDVAATRKIFGEKIPPAVVDLMDEPAGITFTGPEYDREFAKFLQTHGLTPDFFGQKSWDDVHAIRTKAPYFWWDFFPTRKEQGQADLIARRLFYWSTYFLTHANAQLFALATRAVEKYAPETLGTRVNMGPPWWYDYGTIPRGIDNFGMGRLGGVSMAFNEDWIGNGDPRWPLEITAFLADWDNAPFRPRTPLAGGYITRDANRTAAKLRVFGFLARDTKVFDFYYYGPSYGQFDHWSDNRSMVQGVAELSRDIGRADNILWDAHPPQPQVALLYTKSWPVWKADDTEQVELLMTWLALFHAGIAVDIIADEQVEAGGLDAGQYQCLYVVNESVPARTAATIEQWVKKGGHLWASGWAGACDEYNTPTDAWNQLLGVKERSWKAVGNLKRLGDLIQYADERRPYFARLAQLVPTAGDQPAGATNLNFVSTTQPADQPVARAWRQPYGAGVVQVVPWTAGKDYIDGAQKTDGAIAQGAIVYPADQRRDVVAGFAREAVHPLATTSVSQILAWPLWTKKQGVVLLANYTGQPADKVRVTFTAPLRVRTVQSLRAGKLRIERRRDGSVSCTLPVREVTDILLINE